MNGRLYGLCRLERNALKTIFERSRTRVGIVDPSGKVVYKNTGVKAAEDSKTVIDFLKTRKSIGMKVSTRYFLDRPDAY